MKRVATLTAAIALLAAALAAPVHVSEGFALQQGRLGRSLGCPAVRSEIARPLIDTIASGSFLFVHYPDPSWLEDSALLRKDCSPG